MSNILDESFPILLENSNQRERNLVWTSKETHHADLEAWWKGSSFQGLCIDKGRDFTGGHRRQYTVRVTDCQ